MVDDKELVILDQQIGEKKWLPGPESERIFTNHYKRLGKVIDQNFSTDTPNSHLTNMLLVQESYRILPSKLGLVKSHKSPNTVSLK